MQLSRSSVSIIATLLFIVVALVRCASAASQRAQDASANAYNATEFARARATCTAGNGFFYAPDQYFFNATCIPLVTRTPTPIGGTPTDTAASAVSGTAATVVGTPTSGAAATGGTHGVGVGSSGQALAASR
jgi:hypothetical protein